MMGAALRFLGAVGRGVNTRLGGLAGQIGAVAWLLIDTLGALIFGTIKGKTRIRKQLFPLMSNVGLRSAPIIALVSFLIGAILVLNTAPIIQQYGQTQQIPTLVTLSMTREMGPLMTAILMTARVGASYTAVLASMKINDEIMALETMAIHPVGYLVAPRFLSMVVMTPCLTLMSYVIGMMGGALIATKVYGLTLGFYVNSTLETLTPNEIAGGLTKAVIFSVIISMTCCHFGLTTRGGPMGLGRNTMVAVVTSIVSVILADALLTGLMVKHLW